MSDRIKDLARDVTPKQKKLALRILIAAAWLIALEITRHAIPELITTANGVWIFIFYLPPYFIAGWDVLYQSVRHILNGQIFDENFLMSLATIGALAIGEYPEAVFVMLFYQTGEWFQNYAVGRSRRSVADLMDIRPDTAHVERENNNNNNNNAQEGDIKQDNNKIGKYT